MTNVGLFRVQPRRAYAMAGMLLESEIEDVIEDEEGFLWVATRGGLIQILDPPFRLFAAAHGQQEVLSLVEDRRGVVWFVSRQPPYLQKVENGRAVAVRGPLPEGLSGVLEDESGRLLLGARDGVYVGEAGGWTRRIASPGGPIVAIAEDAARALWIGCEDGVVHDISPGGRRSFGPREGLPGARIERLYAARDGTVWVATHDGVYGIRGERVEELRLGSEPGWRYVRHVSEDADGVLWIGTRAGLARVKNGQVFMYGPRQGLPDPVVHSIVDDRAGHIFVGSSRGIFRAAKADLARVASGEARDLGVMVFGRRGGFVSNQAWGNSALRARNGALWFTTRRGVSSIPAANIETVSVPPPVILESVVINGQARDLRRPAEIESGEGRLEFRYTAFSFQAPSTLRFRYRLEGLESDWREAQDQREALYAHVAPGRYVFRVTAAGADGVWHPQGATFDFELKPRWYARTEWRWTAATLLLVLAWGLHRWRVRALHQREGQLARRVEERTLALKREVTERTQAEQEVRRLAGALEARVGERTAELGDEKERLAVTLRSIGDGVIATDVRGRVILLNRVAETLTGWAQREAEGRHISEVFNVCDCFTHQPLPDLVAAVIARSVVLELPSEAVLLGRDGRERLVADSAAPIRDRDSRVTGAVLVFRDVTEKRRIEEHLAHTGKFECLGILAAGIAHDFNNLLTGVFGYVDLARKSLPEDSRAFQRLSKALEALDRARGLSGQLLTFTSMGTPVTTLVDAGALLENGVRFSLAGSNVSSEIRVPPGLWLCDVDAGQIGQVVDNLVINARQAMAEGGRIEVWAENVTIERDPILEPGRYVKMYFRDHGPGIAPEQHRRVFDPFFTTKAHGSGLGLATVHSIVTRHRGHVDFESRLGEGATFFVFLPAASSGPEAVVGEVPEVGLLEGRVLVMDDEEVVRQVLLDTLVGLGLRVDTVVDGGAAIQAAEQALREQARYDLAILDLTIPGGMGGVEALARLRQLDPGLGALASSGYSSDAVMQNPEGFGFQGTLVKPYTVAEIGRVVAAALRGTARRAF